MHNKNIKVKPQERKGLSIDLILLCHRLRKQS